MLFGRRRNAVVSACLAVGTVLADVVLDAANGFGGRLSADRARIEMTGDVLAISDIGHDCRVFLEGVCVDPSEVDQIIVRYRANGTSDKTGQFFFARAGERFREHAYFKLDAPKADGQWHVVTNTVRQVRDTGSWINGGLMERFGFDPTDGSGGSMEVSEIRFAKGMREASGCDPRLEAPQWPAVRPDVWPKPLKVEQPKIVALPQKGWGATVEPMNVMAGDEAFFRFDFEGDLPETPFDATLVFRVNGIAWWREPIHVTQRNIRRFSTKRWRLEVRCQTPLYFSSRTFDVRLESTSLDVRSGRPAETRLALKRRVAVPGFEQRPIADVTNESGYPTFRINGRAFYPLWGAVAQEHRPDGLPRHSSAPLNIVTVYNWHDLWWPTGEVFDPADFDRQAELYRRKNPDAWFMWDITIYPPQSWGEENLEELSTDGNGRITNDGGPRRRLNYSFSSEKALAAMERALDRAIRYLENAPYANRIVGYRINSGHTIEWLGWEPGRDTTLDFSRPAAVAFERFARTRYPKLSDFGVPMLSDRCELDGNDLLWDQVKHVKSIAYHDFHSHSIADAIIRLCRRAKELTGGRKLVGTYYGYVMTLGQHGACQMRGHYATKHLLDAKPVDFLLSPQPYSIRNLGEIAADMKPFASIAAHGIVPVVEDDTRTSNAPPTPNTQMLTAAHSRSLLRHNAGSYLCRNQGLLFYALCGGTEFDTAYFAEDAADWKTVGEHCMEKRTKRCAEVAVVVSEEAIKAMPMLRGLPPYLPGELSQGYRPDGTVEVGERSGVPLTTEAYACSLMRLGRIGAPVDYLLAEDLEKHPGNYRLYVFVNAWKSTPALVRAAKALRARDCTLLWLYAPGFMNDGGNGTVSMEELTGMRFVRRPSAFVPAVTLSADGRRMGAKKSMPFSLMFSVANPDSVLGTYEDGSVGVAEVRTGKARSVFCGTIQTDVRFFRDVAQKAGVHLYSREGDPLEANERLISLHARTSGEKHIALPRPTDVYDVYSHKLIARGVKSFSFVAPLHSSWLFYCADDASQLFKRNED